LGQTSSAHDAAAHQRYIEREEACAASFGVIADTLEERERLWRELEARGTKRAGRVELGPGVPPAAKRAVLRDLAALRGPTPGGMARDYVERLLTLDSAGLDARKVSIRTATKADHDAFMERLTERLETNALRDASPETRSALGEAPEPAAWPAGVHLRPARTAAVVLTADAPQEARDVIAALAASPEEARALGLRRVDCDAWRAGPKRSGEQVLRTTGEVADAVLAHVRTALGIDSDSDIPGVSARSVQGVEARLERGSPPVVKYAALKWWHRHAGGESPWPDPAGRERWQRLSQGGPWALYDNEDVSLHVPTRDRPALEQAMRDTVSDVRARPDRPGNKSIYEPRPRKPTHRHAGVREFRPTESIVQRRIIIELAHELGDAARENALRAWCEKNLRGHAWHAVIHAPESQNDPRNWHAHVVYSNVAVERRKGSMGWTFEDEKGKPKPTETTRTLSGNGPLKGTGRNLLIQRWRREICELQNAPLAEAKVDKVYDHRSYAAMGIDRVPGEHLGPGRFRRELDGTTRARGASPAAWSDAEEALRERLRREGADHPTRDAACELLELHRLVHTLPSEGDGARPELERARDEAGAQFLAKAGPRVAAAANRTIAEWLADVTLAPEPEDCFWWRKANRDIESITDPWLAAATAERRWSHRLNEPGFLNAHDLGDRDARHLAETVEDYRETFAPRRVAAREALEDAPRGHRRDRAAERVEKDLRAQGWDHPMQPLGYALGTEIAAGAARAGRRRELCDDIADWARVWRLEDKPQEVRDAARRVQDAHAVAFEESPELAERFAAVAKRVERSAAAREAWQAAGTPEEMQAFRGRYRRLIPTLTARERAAVRAGVLAGETPKHIVAALTAALADPGPGGSDTLRNINPEEWTLARTYAVRATALATTRLKREAREDAALAQALTELGEDPPVLAWVSVEKAHAGALTRDSETADRIAETIRAAEPTIRTAILALPAPGDDDAAWHARRIEHDWTAERRERCGATGATWQAHLEHAERRATHERAATREALRDAESGPAAAAGIMADPTRLRWLDDATRQVLAQFVDRSELARARASREAFLGTSEEAQERRRNRLRDYAAAERQREHPRLRGQKLPPGPEGRRILRQSDHNLADLALSPASAMRMLGESFKADQAAADAVGMEPRAERRAQRVATSVFRISQGPRSGDFNGEVVVRSFDADAYAETSVSSAHERSEPYATIGARVTFLRGLAHFTPEQQEEINAGRDLAGLPRFRHNERGVFLRLNGSVLLNGVRELVDEECQRPGDRMPVTRKVPGVPVGPVSDADAMAWAATPAPGMQPFEDAPVRGGEVFDALGIGRDTPPRERPTNGEVLDGTVPASPMAVALVKEAEADYGLPRIVHSNRTLSALAMDNTTPVGDRPTFRSALQHGDEAVRNAALRACKGHVVAQKGGIGSDAVLALYAGPLGDTLLNAVRQAERGSERGAGSISVDREGKISDNRAGLVNAGSLSFRLVRNVVPREVARQFARRAREHQRRRAQDRAGRTAGGRGSGVSM